MSLEQIRNVVLLFSNPVWSGANTVPSTIIRNITSLSSNIAYQDTIVENLTTLSSTNSDTEDGIIRGLLYVPDLAVANPCYQQQYDIIPRNATTQAALPPTNYNLIALAPWFNATCTLAYLASARLDPIRAFIFYRPNNSTREPQGADSPIWDLDDNDAWRTQNRFPIFAVPGAQGNKMMRQLSLYSGNLSSIPYGDQIQDIYDPHDNDYVRIWTELTVKDRDSVPAMWTWILTVVGVVIFIIACLSLTMHLVQRRRRISLRRRVLSGEVDLEAMGIKRITVPIDHVKGFPLFTYSFQPEMVSSPATTRPPKSVRSPRSQRTVRTVSESAAPKSRARRSSVNSATSTVATNFQPQCHICLENYVDRESIIRELPCGHIFHPECIDEFLSLNSSLCPICKRNMLPRNYCPKITNGMVRRERAVRRLRERVIVVESDDEEEEVKGKSWGRRLFGTDKAASSPKETPMTPVTTSRSPKTAQESATARTPAPAETEDPRRSTLEPTQEEHEDSDRPSSQSGGQEPTQPISRPPQASPAAHHGLRGKRRKSGGLRLHMPGSDDTKQTHTKPEGRKSPSALARARMRALAGTPLDDPDGRNPIWKRYVVKVFPGFS